ncbi:MAG: MFS transporter, partial [Frankiales bacterium]|nr:MFS transporter [Frankiales bacterium]
AFASWISRLPAVRDALELDSGALGLLLLCLAAGAVVSLPLSGAVIARVGPASSVLGGAAVVSAGLLAVAAGVAAASTPIAAFGLLVTGLGTGLWDVAMNVEGAAVEQRLGRSLMPRLHAAFSIGTVAGALIGAAAAALSVPVAAQLVATAGVAVSTMAVAVRSFLPAGSPAVEVSPPIWAAWRERRTLAIGLLVLCCALVEGVANDWLTIALVDGHGASPAVGALAFGLFVTAMTAVRLVGGPLLARHGRPAVLRASAALAAVGLLLVTTADALPLVLAGPLLWGAGAALGFPVGMSAAADEPARAPARVSVVSSIGYTAFLGGPPLVGFLAQAHGILQALLVVLVALGAVGALATVSRQPVPAAR